MWAACGEPAETRSSRRSLTPTEHPNRSADNVAVWERLTSNPTACYAVSAGRLLRVAGSSVDGSEMVSATSAEADSRHGSRMMPEHCLRRALADSSTCTTGWFDLPSALAVASLADRPPRDARRRSPCNGARLVHPPQAAPLTLPPDGYNNHHPGCPSMPDSTELSMPRLATKSLTWLPQGALHVALAYTTIQSPDQSHGVCRKQTESLD